MANKDYHETAIRRSNDSFLAAANRLKPKPELTFNQIKQGWKDYQRKMEAQKANAPNSG